MFGSSNLRLALSFDPWLVCCSKITFFCLKLTIDLLATSRIGMLCFRSVPTSAILWMGLTRVLKATGLQNSCPNRFYAGVSRSDKGGQWQSVKHLILLSSSNDLCQSSFPHPTIITCSSRASPVYLFWYYRFHDHGEIESACTYILWIALLWLIQSYS